MASREPYYSFKETRLNFEPSSAAYIVDVKLPTNAAPQRARRHANGSSQGNADADAFRTRNCATASAIYIRQHHQYPRSFLWRLLEDDSVLSLRVVDVCKPKNAADTNLILNFHFPNPIQPSCIAFADPPDHDALSVFVIDKANQLYSLFLRPDSFRKRSSADGSFGDACKIYSPNAFAFKSPYRLLAVNSNELAVTLSDGGHLRLDRNTSPNAGQTPWKETFQNAKGWIQGFRNLLWERDVDQTAAAAAVQTDLGLDDASFLFTVCRDHRLRIWNFNSGQILKAMDLLNATRDVQETGKWHIDALQTNLIRIVGNTEGRRLGVTYSPVGAGEFKFWMLSSDRKDDIDVDDMYPDARLIPVPPGSDVWTVADFSVTAHEPGKEFTMWILWKNNMTYRVQELSFLADELPEAWQDGWRYVFFDAEIPTASASSPSDPVDPAERWLRLILSPGRFPKATLEAALRAYERAVGLSPEEKISRTTRTLAEAISSAVTSLTSLNKASSGELDYDNFRSANELQWRKFYRILIEIDKPRGEALALAYEAGSGMPWVVCADTVAAIRECSKMEQIYHNPLAVAEDTQALQKLVNTGLGFVEGFSDAMMQICHSVLRSELFEETSQTEQERIQYFSDKAGFWRQISDEDCAQVTEVLGDNFQHVSTQLYHQLLATCGATVSSQHSTEFPSTEFGRRVIVSATQNMTELQWKVWFSQLILLVHMEFEFDNPQDALHHRVNIGAVYQELLRCLGRLELLRWLANTLISTPLSKTDRSSMSNSSPAVQKRQGEDTKVVTALEGMIGHLLGLPEMDPDHPDANASTLTSLVADICASDSEMQLQPEFIQCGLLVRDRADLAVELVPFCDQSPFSTYVQGRVYLALRDFTTASAFFEKAAYGMSSKRKNPDKHSSGLLDETEWNLLYQGLPRYYAHIVSLYEKPRAYSFVVHFARLAVRFINKNTEDADLVRTEIQSRLFSGATAISHFDLAHSTLVAMKDRALQHSCLRALIQKMCDNLHNAELVELSFPGLQNAVDDILAQKCHDTMDVVTGVPYHQILYSWRIKRNDYRGAATVLLDRIQKLRLLGEGDQPAGDDALDTTITRQYLILINVLSCVDQKQAWIITDRLPGPLLAAGAPSDGKRRVLTLADIRKEYQDELDRIAAIENNQFGFTAEDEMEIL
ncbi:nucleoporin Nup120/160-domain-containing protein [Xylariomycetidae sp. FL0641]|nr:nucleoporin Nup120/160-domain-containing protein [Xylariomycetidae sp. FL0641]